MARAPRSGRVLNNADAAQIKSMLNRNDRQHDIAAYFAVNGGRVGEISAGRTFAAVAPATGQLPPPPPYVVIPAALRNEAEDLKVDLANLKAPASVIAKIDRIIDAMEQSRRARRGV